MLNYKEPNKLSVTISECGEEKYCTKSKKDTHADPKHNPEKLLKINFPTTRKMRNKIKGGRKNKR